MLTKQAKTLSTQQINKMLDHLRGTRYPTRNRVCFLASVFGGMRSKEISELKWGMVQDPEGNFSDSIHLPNNASKGKSGGRVIPMHNALYFNIDLLKSTDSNYRITKLHLAFDIPLDSTIGHFFTTIDNFLFLKLAKTERINSPFNFYVNEKDGSRTHYPEELTKNGNKPSVHSRAYGKHDKEGLKQRMLRFEVCFEGDALNKVGNNPKALIKYLEKEIGRYRLKHFEDVRACNKFKEQYAENILKNKHKAVRNNVRRNRKHYEHLTPNITVKLLSEVEESSTAIPLELTDEIRKILTDMFDKNVKMEPPQFRKKVNHDRIKRCRIRQRLKLRWLREGREKLEQNKLGIREMIEDSHSWNTNHSKSWALNLEGWQFFYTPAFYVLATGPPIGKYMISYLNGDKIMLERQQLYPLVWQHQLLSF